MYFCANTIITMEKLYKAFLACNGVCTDSRACQAGNLFVCLKGENFDGNDYAEKAVEMGAKYVLTSRKDLTESPYIYVEDTLAALQQLAAHHRKVLGTPIVGITGTNGKTTTKELVSAVLAKKYNVLYTLGNFNNHIGVPLTLLRLTKQHNMAVIEMGANHPGEIAFLANIVMPDAGLITNVGKAHLAGFGSFEGVKKTKAELYGNLKSRGKMVFIDDDNPHLKEMLANIENDESVNRLKLRLSESRSNVYIDYAESEQLHEGEARVIGESTLRQAQGPETESAKRLNDSTTKRLNNRTELYGSDATLPVNGKVISCTPFVNISLNIDGQNYTVNSQLIGSYNVSNMLSAACVGHYFGVPAHLIAEALSQYTPQNNRSQLTKTARNTLIIDAYNANPTSMEAALRNFALIETDGKAVILGDMFELGDDSAAEHQKVVQQLAQLGITEAYLLGENFSKTQGVGTRFASTPAFKQWLAENPLSGKTLLIKGSNSMKLTTLVEGL